MCATAPFGLLPCPVPTETNQELPPGPRSKHVIDISFLLTIG